jgi:LysR family transcriptional regulator for bpeEF and oprC
MKSVDPLAGISTFLTVAALESFSAAADDLGISRATVSSQVSDLERRLGVRLLQRNTRRVCLTEAGQAYFEGLQGVTRRLEDAKQVATEYQTEATGLLRIVTQAELAHRYIIPVLKRFLADYPKVSVELSLSAAPEPLVGSRFHLAINTLAEPAETQVVRRLGGGDFVFVASPAYRAERGDPDGPQDLVHHRCLHLAVDPGGRHWILRRGQERVEVPIAPRVEINDSEALRQAALDGLGIAMLADFQVRDDLEEGRLVRMLGDWAGPEINLNILYPGNRFIPLKVRAFVKALTSTFNVIALGDRHLEFASH